MKIFDIIDELQGTSSKIDKQYIIAQNADNENFKEVLKMAYDKIGINYHVKKGWYPEFAGDLTLDSKEGIERLRKDLNSLSSREITGNDAIDLVETLMNDFVEEEQEIIEGILQRDLYGGFSASTINKAIPGLIPVFDVVLAKSYDDHKKKVWNGSQWYASRKLDGLRCIAMREGDTFKFFSRKGKPFLTLDNLIPELLELSGDNENIVFDGEVCLMKDGKEDFKGISKEYNKKNHTITNPRYNIFDCLTKEEFYSQTSERILSTRLTELKKMFSKLKDFNSEAILASRFQNKHFISFLTQLPLSEDTFVHLQKQVEQFGWEGLILRKDVVYKGKRTDELLKVKKFFDDEYKVLDVLTGPFAYTIPGKGQTSEEMLTAVIIEHKGQKVQVGSGWSIDERKKYYKNPKSIIGKEITVQYFEETLNDQGTISLRFPTLKAIHGVKRDV